MRYVLGNRRKDKREEVTAIRVVMEEIKEEMAATKEVTAIKDESQIVAEGSIYI
jgi:hypothetical protein